ncbi:hypothetical protein SAMN04487948_12636 [Halogranum amylolyticum]|uniref:Uncharacterized protein n=1 Tax=Halogranum amylolyticum TaxID=660520 RepID=A0A1H8WCM8_9EURY|nr:hypothetical protein SAMN04487948_12636 [Halogranum amylolyticum]
MVSENDHLEMQAKMSNLQEATWANTKSAPLDDKAFRQAYSAVVAGLQ